MKTALELLREIRAREGREGPPNASPEPTSEDRFECFLADSSIPAAVFFSRRFNRPFLLVRDGADLDELTAEEQALPVIWFSECEQLELLEPEDLGAILNIRAVFGPSVKLVSVKPADGTGERH